MAGVGAALSSLPRSAILHAAESDQLQRLVQKHGRRVGAARFVAGETLVLSNADLLGEGFDVPAIEAAILLRPTQSLSLHLQQIGRTLRPCDGKQEAILLDHAGNCARHGLPDDEREWSLEDRERRKKKASDGPPVRTCTKCFRVYRPAPKCPGCGHATPVQAREVEQRDGTLVEIDPNVIKLQRKTELKAARTYDELVELGRRRGYKHPAGWARHMIAGREAWRART